MADHARAKNACSLLEALPNDGEGPGQDPYVPIASVSTRRAAAADSLDGQEEPYVRVQMISVMTLAVWARYVRTTPRERSSGNGA